MTPPDEWRQQAGGVKLKRRISPRANASLRKSRIGLQWSAWTLQWGMDSARDCGPMPAQCQASVADAGPTLSRHWAAALWPRDREWAAGRRGSFPEIFPPQSYVSTPGYSTIVAPTPILWYPVKTISSYWHFRLNNPKCCPAYTYPQWLTIRTYKLLWVILILLHKFSFLLMVTKSRVYIC